ncbi:MAG: hypothetical protein IT447_08160 [Phycisphaerales bacterium]|jgi:hypothetical protein|nr:hypothetical protein [Phycisphaerales bacterium]
MNTSDPAARFERTKCACRLCAISCEHLPGALSPADVGRIATHLGYATIESFADECLLRSEGATLQMRDGRMVSLPTLVPATRENGACRFHVDGKCDIHAVSPFGCSHIDAHMPDSEFRRRSDALHESLLDDFEQNGAYTRLCAHLEATGRAALPRATRQYRLAKAMRKEFGGKKK